MLRFGRKVAIMMQVMLAGIARRILHHYGKVVMVDRGEQQHWQENCQQQACRHTAPMRNVLSDNLALLAAKIMINFYNPHHFTIKVMAG